MSWSKISTAGSMPSRYGSPVRAKCSSDLCAHSTFSWDTTSELQLVFDQRLGNAAHPVVDRVGPLVVGHREPAERRRAVAARDVGRGLDQGVRLAAAAGVLGDEQVVQDDDARAPQARPLPLVEGEAD